MKRWLLALALLIPTRGYANITVVTSGIAGSVDGGNNVVTGSFDSTGGNFIATAIADLYSTTACTPTDSKSNSYTKLATRETTLGSQATIAYVAAATVGSGHTITCSTSAGFPRIAYIVFAGVKTSSPFDQQNGANSSGAASSLSTGSITPTENNEVVIAILGHTIGVGSDAMVDSGFTMEQRASANAGGCNCFGLAMTYIIQATAGAVNPTLSVSAGTDELSAAIASFKAAASTSTGGAYLRRRRN